MGYGNVTSLPAAVIGGGIGGTAMQAARVVLIWPSKWMKHSFGPWLAAAAQRLHHNVLATALANKLARIALSVLAQDRRYEARVPGTGAT